MHESASLQTRLSPTLAALSGTDTARFDPVRFQYLLALANKAESQRSAVADVLEKKAAAVLEKYLDDYSASREADAASDNSDSLCPSRALADLSRELSSGHQRRPSSANPLLDDLWQQQEQVVLQTVAENRQAKATASHCVPATGNPGAMHQLRQSLHRGYTDKRIQQSILEGPETPGPLNPEALIIGALSEMQEISAAYTHRLVDYLDSLLWLGQASQASQRKKKGSGKK